MASNVSPKDRANFNNFLRNHKEFSVQLIPHAIDSMEKRGVTLEEVRKVLRRGALQLVEVDIRAGDIRYRVAGNDSKNQPLEVVAVLDETGDGCVVVVTVIRPGRL